MPFNWRWLFLIALFGLRLPPQFYEDTNQLPYKYNDRDEIPFPRTVSLLPSQPVGLFVEDQCVIQEMDSGVERECLALQPIGTPTIHLDTCPLPEICSESDHPSTGTDLFEATTKMMGNISALIHTYFTSMSREVGLHVRALSEMIISNPMQKWQPGSVLQRAKIVIALTPVLDVFLISVFIWRKFKSMNNQMNCNDPQSPVNISVLTKKIRGMRGKLRTTKRMLSASHRSNRKLKVCIRKLERTCRMTTKERDALILAVREREEGIKNAQLERATIIKAFHGREMALQQQLDQLEQEWRGKLDEAMQDRREYEEHMKKEIQHLQHMLSRTEQAPVKVFQSRKEIIDNAACDFIAARRKMALSWEKCMKFDKMMAS